MDFELVALNAAELAVKLETGKPALVIDIRSSGQYCTKHVKSAESLTFSNMILRRLLKGLVTLESLIPVRGPLMEKLCPITGGAAHPVVMYDNGSATGNVTRELLRYTEVICKARSCAGEQPRTIYFVDGGFPAFATQFPSLCETSPSGTSEERARSPFTISLHASLPLSFPTSSASSLPLQTPQADDSFGPPVEILPHLVLGCEKDSANLALLRQMEITAVLNVSSNCPNHFGDLFEYMNIPVEDSHQADLLSKLQSAFDFIDTIKSKGGRIFVHCHAGISRSATVCIAYVMKHLAYDLTDAYSFVKRKRPRVSPNLHFMGQLVLFQKHLQHESPSTCASMSANLIVDELVQTVSTSGSFLPGLHTNTTLHFTMSLPVFHRAIQ